MKKVVTEVFGNDLFLQICLLVILVMISKLVGPNENRYPNFISKNV